MLLLYTEDKLNTPFFGGIVMDALFLCLLLWCSISDVRKRSISNALIVTLLCLGLAHTVVASFAGVLWWQYPAGLFLSIPFFIAWLKNGMGGGDVKLIAAAGLYLGLMNTLTAFMLMIPIFAGLLAWSWLKYRTLNRRIPLAPVISAGATGVILLGYVLKLLHH
jgi:leader peptidase (prepilin peptidase) / N-methyltransferase